MGFSRNDLKILAIDPGPTQSAYVLMIGEEISMFAKCDNVVLCDAITTKLIEPDELVIEKIASYGMPVGQEVFETVFWSGRFAQAHYAHLSHAYRITRKEVVLALCNSPRGNDASVRAALIDRYGGKEKAIGRKPKNKREAAAGIAPGPLAGIKDDCWAALAVAVVWRDHRWAGIQGRSD